MLTEFLGEFYSMFWFSSYLQPRLSSEIKHVRLVTVLEGEILDVDECPSHRSDFPEAYRVLCLSMIP